MHSFSVHSNFLCRMLQQVSEYGGRVFHLFIPLFSAVIGDSDPRVFLQVVCTFITMYLPGHEATLFIHI
jgi:hypothetical protein